MIMPVLTFINQKHIIYIVVIYVYYVFEKEQ
jgi:hypothetical protein